MNTTTTHPLTLNPGDKVAHSTQFLESIGESHGEMAEGRGIVRESEAENEDFVLIFVEWQGRSLPQRMRESNLTGVGANSRFCKCCSLFAEALGQHCRRCLTPCEGATYPSHKKSAAASAPADELPPKNGKRGARVAFD